MIEIKLYFSTFFKRNNLLRDGICYKNANLDEFS